MPIFYRFRDSTIYRSKTCVFRRFSHPSLVCNPHKGRVPLGLVCESWSQKYSFWATRRWKPHDPVFISFDSIPACDGQTGRRTDKPLIPKSPSRSREVAKVLRSMKHDSQSRSSTDVKCCVANDVTY